jgi:hypothetical protein
MKTVMWTGPEDVRIIAKADLGIEPDSTEEFVWSADTRYMQEMSEEEFDKLVELTGPGTWSTVEMTDAEPVEPQPKSKAKVTPVSDDESSGASATP